ncbi:MAG: glycosyltransferase [Dehalococcoidia bacterium]|nr:glycosyltransferase [Dehalococcoidia bacterium]
MPPESGEPLVSVVIPARESARYLRGAISSVLTQSYGAVECIVRDGGSTDATAAILESFGDRIRWHSQPDDGPFEAIEAGWAEARGDILAWINADDRYLPGAISRAVAAFAAHPEADVIYGASAGIDNRGRLIWWGEARPFSLEAAILDADHVINQPAAFIRRRAYERTGGLLHEWVHDHDLWLRIAVTGGVFVPIPETLAAVRIRDENQSMAPEFAIARKRMVVERWLADERVPAAIRSRAKRARSNAWLRGLHYLRPVHPRDWLLGARYLGHAFAADPANAPAIIARPARLAAAMAARPIALRRARRRMERERLEA